LQTWQANVFLPAVETARTMAVTQSHLGLALIAIYLPVELSLLLSGTRLDDAPPEQGA
jgi:hypothetical protein